MFVYNLKINKSSIFKLLLSVLAIIVLSLMAVIGFNLFSQKETDKNLIDDTVPKNEVATIKPENYTNILKCVHNDINTYVGQKISFSGYVYRVNDFTDDQFVLARDMDVGNNQTVIVGFLCSFENAKQFENYTWVTITAEITKGTYQSSDMPILKVTKIDKTDKPENDTVPMPDDTYVPTCVIY